MNLSSLRPKNCADVAGVLIANVTQFITHSIFILEVNPLSESTEILLQICSQVKRDAS